jgi:hypothetical protein
MSDAVGLVRLVLLLQVGLSAIQSDAFRIWRHETYVQYA